MLTDSYWYTIFLSASAFILLIYLQDKILYLWCFRKEHFGQQKKVVY